MISNNNTILLRIRNNGSFIASVVINLFFQGEIRTVTLPDINPNMEYTGDYSKLASNFHIYFHNKSAEGNPVFDEEIREYAVNMCFLLTGDATHPLCIPIPCSSLNYCNNYSNYCNCRYF